MDASVPKRCMWWEVVLVEGGGFLSYRRSERVPAPPVTITDRGISEFSRRSETPGFYSPCLAGRHGPGLPENLTEPVDVFYKSNLHAIHDGCCRRKHISLRKAFRISSVESRFQRKLNYPPRNELWWEPAHTSCGTNKREPIHCRIPPAIDGKFFERRE